MIISCIVAMNKEGLIGIQNKIPWHLPADLKYFKKVTSGHHILMGRKCFESIGRPLPNRTNIIITRNSNFQATNCIIRNSIAEGIEYAKENKEDELFIIGGGEIYKESLTLCHRMYLTEVDFQGAGDVYFPTWDPTEWKITSEEKFLADEQNTISYSFRILQRYDKRDTTPIYLEI